MNLKRWVRLSQLGYRVLQQYPHPKISKLNLALTFRCNHRCVSCNIWQHNAENRDEITIGDFTNLLAKNPAIFWVSLTGGEPSLARDWQPILRHSLQTVPLTNVITNGERPDLIIKAVKHALSSSEGMLIIHVTLFGEQEIQEQMTGVKNSYIHAIETALGLRELGFSDRLIVGFEHMIGHNNGGEYKFIQYKANRMGVGITYTLEQEAGYYQNNNGNRPLPESPKFSPTFNPIDILKNTFLLNAKRRAGCVANEYSLWVTPEQKVYPCFFRIPNGPSYDLKGNNWKLAPNAVFADSVDHCDGCWTPCESYPMMIWRPWRIFR